MSGLYYQHVQLAYERNVEDGIQALFSEKFNGTVLRTKSRKIISSVQSYTQYFHSNKKRKDSLETRAEPAVFSL